MPRALGAVITQHDTVPWLVYLIAVRIKRGSSLLAHLVLMFTSANQMTAVLDTKHDDTLPPPPPHWIFDGEPDSPRYTGSFKQRAVVALHRTLCIVTFGEKSLRPIWERKHAPESGAWEYGRDTLRERIQHTNIVVRAFGFCVGVCFPIFVGRFTSHHDRGLLHHRCTEGLRILSVHEGGSYLSLPFGPRVFLRGTHRRVHDRGGDRESAVRLVL